MISYTSSTISISSDMKTIFLLQGLLISNKLHLSICFQRIELYFTNNKINVKSRVKFAFASFKKKLNLFFGRT